MLYIVKIRTKEVIYLPFSYAEGILDIQLSLYRISSAANHLHIKIIDYHFYCKLTTKIKTGDDSTTLHKHIVQEFSKPNYMVDHLFLHLHNQTYFAHLLLRIWQGNWLESLVMKCIPILMVWCGKLEWICWYNQNENVYKSVLKAFFKSRKFDGLIKTKMFLNQF